MRYVKKLPIPKVVLGISVFCFGLHLVFFDGHLYGLIIAAFGAFLLLAEGSEIDLEGKRYREIRSFAGITFGTWKALPAVEYISVFKTKEKYKLQARAASAHVGSEVYKLNLFYNRNRKIEAYRTQDREDAFKVAHHFSQALDIDVLDATTNDFKWL